jgi:hypothetical protein
MLTSVKETNIIYVFETCVIITLKIKKNVKLNSKLLLIGSLISVLIVKSRLISIQNFVKKKLKVW